MKYICLAIILTFSTLTLSSKSYGKVESPVLKGAYLGQKPPSLTPEVFAPGIVSTENYSYGAAFTPDMNELYYLRVNGKDSKATFVVFKKKTNQWYETEISPSVGQPFIAPDGKTMHLGRRYKTLTANGWSEIEMLDASFQDIQIMRLTASSKGTYVFDEAGWPEGNGVIRYSRLTQGKREEPQPFGKEINTGKFNAHPFIAPDESYLIWDGRRDSGFGGADIYISFRQQNGAWGDAINLGNKINTEGWDAAASVTPDGKYLFFHRLNEAGNANIFWVDAKIIETFRPKP
tara:strand:- start:1167 stop:2036 length:870 start_codon:yes stop_codon:yes gene_type:complete